MRRLIEAANVALDESAAAIRPYFRTGVGVDNKSDESPVTAADRKAEQILRAVLAEATPDFGIIGEEFPSHNTAARHVWVIDPIDGTRAFITGRTSFTTLLGLLEDGVPVLGFIDQPVTRERWAGGRGVSAQFTGGFGGVPGTRQTVRLAQAEFSCTSPEMIESAGQGAVTRFNRLKRAAKRIYWGGDAYGFGLLALGQIDLIAENDLKPWDWAALAPVIEAAGGVVTDWSGAPLRLGCDGSVLASANRVLHDEALAVLNS
ncbi:inositol monophosphatase family protein [Acidocella sp.]|uniref:inositol monophosphatase family protein n=1 Tax=Acidocella sp. TaxID=50710 RepID=UPI00260819F2|nr:inositol monophosphatase family protein [Acidocella sp.]